MKSHAKNEHVPATEMKNRFGYYLKRALQSNKPVYIELHGQPVAMLGSIAAWEDAHPTFNSLHSWLDQAEILVASQTPSATSDVVELLRQMREDRDNQLG